MKQLLLLPMVIIFIAMGCKKQPEQGTVLPPPPPPPPPVLNTPPVVSAQQLHIQLMLPVDSCILTGRVIASGSSIKSYSWEKVYGPAGYIIEHPDSLTSKVRALQVGTYIFHLTVTDSAGLKGKAGVTVTVTPFVAYEYDLNMNIHTGYSFLNNTEVCWWDCYYVDVTEITTSYQMSPSDILQLHIYEETDSAFNAYNIHDGFTNFRLSNQLYASGSSSYNLKKIIQQGGGSFSGTITLTSSSALGTARENAFKALPPLTVTGKLDTTTRTVNMQIKGKIIF